MKSINNKRTPSGLIYKEKEMRKLIHDLFWHEYIGIKKRNYLLSLSFDSAESLMKVAQACIEAVMDDVFESQKVPKKIIIICDPKERSIKFKKVI